MVNFLAMQEENKWLADFDVDGLNSELAARRAKHTELLRLGAFWSLGAKEKEAVSPEIREVEWQPLRTAVLNSFTSMNSQLTCVNDFQLQAFKQLGITSRDPMFLTMLSFLELESFPSTLSVQRELTEVTVDEGSNTDLRKEVEAKVKEATWLTEGLLPDQVRLIFNDRAARREAGEKVGNDLMSHEELLEVKAKREAADRASESSHQHARL